MNKVILIGNLTRDPELTETNSGVSVCRFSIAVNRSYGTTADGERVTDFFNVTAWRGLGENVAKYAHKGNKVCVVGSIELRQYEGRDGAKRTAVDIIASEVEFLSSRNADSTQGGTVTARNRTGNTRPALQELDDDGDISF